MNLHVNPVVLTWARERFGVSIEELAEKTDVPVGQIQSWEEGIEKPPYDQLECIADYVKMPIAVFFFPEPPKLEDPKTKFRRLPDFEFARLSPDTFQAIALAEAYQDSLQNIVLDSGSRKKIFRDLKPQSSTVQELAQRARKYLGISIDHQFAFKSSAVAFKTWRLALETAGIFTFKSSMKDRFVSGFCLLHDEFPVIMVNNSNAFARQVFTLAHELGHILFRVNGITDVDETYLTMMNEVDRQCEVDCNTFAAELLVPEEEFKKDIPALKSNGVVFIPEVARKYSVSREVILRRLFEHQLLTANEYDRFSKQWNKDYLRRPGSKPGGNYYYTKLAYLGEGFTRLAFDRYHEGKLDKAEVAAHLNMKARKVDKLERYLFS